VQPRQWRWPRSDGGGSGGSGGGCPSPSSLCVWLLICCSQWTPSSLRPLTSGMYFVFSYLVYTFST
jgi:hypothetical protein